MLLVKFWKATFGPVEVVRVCMAILVRKTSYCKRDRGEVKRETSPYTRGKCFFSGMRSIWHCPCLVHSNDYPAGVLSRIVSDVRREEIKFKLITITQ